MKECDLIIKGRYVLPIDNEITIINQGAVVITDDLIVDIGRSEKMSSAYRPAEMIDAGNSIVMPGLINCHTHIAMSAFRGMADDLRLDDWLQKHIWPAEAKYVDADFVKLFSLLSGIEMIRSGTTCFNDMYFFEEQVGKAAEELGLRAVIGEGVLNFPSPSCTTAEQALKKTEDLIDLFRSSRLINVVLAPHSIYTCDEELLKKVVKIAKENNTLIHIHLAETKKEVEECQSKYGSTPVEYLFKIGLLENTIFAHSIWLNDKDIGILKKKKIGIVHCPTSNMKLGSGIMPIDKMIEHDLTIGLGSDSAASNNNQDMFNEMRQAALLNKISTNDPTNLTVKKIVQMATVNGAKILGLEKKIGSLQIGYKADIITVNLDKPHLTPLYDPYSHLVYSIKGSDVENVIINGKIIMKNTRIRTIDETRVLDSINRLK